MFVDELILANATWQSFERLVCRLLTHSGFEEVHLVGQTGDGGADVLANKFGKRWLFQAKCWKKKAGVSVVDETVQAMDRYRAQIPVLVSKAGFEEGVYRHQRVLHSHSIPIQLWSGSDILNKAKAIQIPETVPIPYKPHEYQEPVIKDIVRAFHDPNTKKALVVMATGLGKTITAFEAIRRIRSAKPIKILFLAHTNDLVYQLERGFWKFAGPSTPTSVWNGYERMDSEDLAKSPCIFGCLNTVADFVKRGGVLPAFDLVLIDECHHIGAQMYLDILEETQVGSESGPFLLGMTATPWRPDEANVYDYFGEPIASIDMVKGLKMGFLSNVDYRMYTDNINWQALEQYEGESFSPKEINRTLFINQWDDAVVYQLQNTWSQVHNPRAIVFCGTIDHAITMRDRINSLGFCRAEALYSQTLGGKTLSPLERNRTLCDFRDGLANVICVVDIMNEGIDVPDVNIIVFQRVTHSRRIFIQQLGRGLRVAEGKDKVIVLDFVSDIRRFAAGIQLMDQLNAGTPKTRRINLPHHVSFRKAGEEDPQTESFLREWLVDIATVEEAGEDASVLKYPPTLSER